jgi:hypothetical protein
MPSLLLHRILVDGTVLSVIASALVLVSMRFDPRIWLHDYPKAIQQAVPKRSAQEKRAARVWTLPFTLTLLAGLAISALLYKRAEPGASFLTLYLDTLGVALFFNVWDLVVLDWLIFCTLTPSFVVLPGTSGMPAYKAMGHHVTAFVAGVISSVVIAAIVAALVYAFG